MSKSLSSRFYDTKVKHLIASEPKMWWSNVKFIIGLKKAGCLDTMRTMANNQTNGNVPELAENINKIHTKCNIRHSTLKVG